MISGTKICVVIPSYKVTASIVAVVRAMPAFVDCICVVDDACPEGSGAFLRANVQHEPRIHIITHGLNQGVGGAVLSGYAYALENGYDVAVKVDGDGQMDPNLIEPLLRPILQGRSDYAKGNRFFSVGMLSEMPGLRLFGNAVLSLVSKATSGYWSVMDPTNGFTAIHTKILRLLPLKIIEKRYFFESDMLYHLGIVRAVVTDVPMFAKYGMEVSNLRIGNVAMDFPMRYGVRFLKRFFYNYLLRDFNVGSIATLLGLPMLSFGIVFGALQWFRGAAINVANAPGTVMLAALPILLGVQMLIAAVLFDVANQPKQPVHPTLG
jgi:dolichol-phosphate mannosyltransferase